MQTEIPKRTNLSRRSSADDCSDFRRCGNDGGSFLFNHHYIFFEADSILCFEFLIKTLPFADVNECTGKYGKNFRIL